jgi:hypothetical protein
VRAADEEGAQRAAAAEGSELGAQPHHGEWLPVLGQRPRRQPCRLLGREGDSALADPDLPFP